MKSIKLIPLLICLPLLASAQETRDLYKIPLQDVREYQVATALESNKKARGVLFGADGRIYKEMDGSWAAFVTGIDASDLRFAMNKKENLFITGKKNGKIIIWESTDRGETWEETGQWKPSEGDPSFYTIHCNRKSGDLSVLYVNTEGEGSACTASVRLVTTGNSGKKWSDPVLLNREGAGCDRIMASMTSFEDGKLFGVWTDENRFMVDRSYDGGERWLRNDIEIHSEYEGLMEYGVPRILMDNSVSQLRGMIYMSGVSKSDSVMRAWIRKSGNLGDSWTGNLPVDPGYEGDQFYPYLAIDQEVGVLYAAWMARTNDMMEVWFAHSLDAGQRFKSQKLSAWQAPEMDIGGYLQPVSVSAYDGKILVTWIEVGETEVVQKVTVLDQEDLFSLTK